MYTSTARKKLQAALASATDPAEIASITTSLSRLIDAEGRDKARKARAKAKRPAPTPPAVDLTAPYDDSDEPFELEPAVPQTTPPQATVSRSVLQDIGAIPPDAEPELVISEHIAELPAPVGKTDGWSRTLSCGSPQTVWDYERQCWAYDLNPTSSVGHYEGAWDPWNTGGECIESNAYTNEGGWHWTTRDGRETNEREQRERQEVEAKERSMQHIYDRMYGR